MEELATEIVAIHVLDVAIIIFLLRDKKKLYSYLVGSVLHPSAHTIWKSDFFYKSSSGFI